MLQRYLRFVRAVSANPLGRLGVVLTTSSFFCFIIMELAQLTGIVTNAYVGLLVYLLFPALFVIGLVLIPIGWRQRRKETGLSSKKLLATQLGGEDVKGSVPVFKTVALMTPGNVIFLGVEGERARAMHEYLREEFLSSFFSSTGNSAEPR